MVKYTIIQNYRWDCNKFGVTSMNLEYKIRQKLVAFNGNACAKGSLNDVRRTSIMIYKKVLVTVLFLSLILKCCHILNIWRKLNYFCDFY